MRSFGFKAIAVCIALATSQVAINVQAATKADATAPAAAPAAQKVSLLGGKLAFTLPAGYVQGEIPEVDAKAKAQGIYGMTYTNKAEKRVIIVAETPIPMGIEASDNDDLVLSGMATGTLAQQRTSYKDFKKLNERTVLKKNGLGVRQIDTSATMSDMKVLSTTIFAASGTRAVTLNLLSRVENPKEHAALVKTVIGQ
ncbi:polyribonucleotide nucleotidyltransferase [Pseudomonas syringae]|uniref:polyribonucleotide nucleotidyltransferase n=1 Tax=Pseudomonas syringae TaxID=317 RepID=UPI0013728945|nr:polyribonucleotide nucleotidyltransferase [Pseudomonas syringae]NAS98937.1 polyribonucleotide nucleotidyltransferase [Pseudomonas syringae pv. actinidifoliorum]NAT24872.1 polyribonucleotide nucleotidyltransferase [Pseudomonas syringae pv. actinidifoliorum]NAT38071.1 polyribonucleotide nucleotidyltransferase [Pseudomonas syringae pv. actinidifoliorum]NAT65707.1 polyribonucleotide nucleotidyltransferase [Pseudomonas syringae pv. actinidifoliorum]